MKISIKHLFLCFTLLFGVHTLNSQEYHSEEKLSRQENCLEGAVVKIVMNYSGNLQKLEYSCLREMQFVDFHRSRMDISIYWEDDYNRYWICGDLTFGKNCCQIEF